MAKIAVSLGDCETLVQLPAAMTHRGYSREDLETFGISEDLIRISVGIEHIDDIIEDISQALEKV
jgi:methionine-gamma-lyase